MAARSLLMIPGPIEISPAVQEAFATPPPSHVAPDVIEAFGASVERMRSVWGAAEDSQPFIVAGSGTLAMEMAVVNLLDPGQNALVVSSGYFSDRMADMLARRGVNVVEVGAAVGDVPNLDDVAAELEKQDFDALYATHVDTSTGVRVDAEALARLAREHDALSIFDGVCATAAERFRMEEWGADVYLTASQKAIGLPPGLALLVASSRAMEARLGLETPPPKSMDFHEWLPIMKAYEARKPSYFATPATNLINALAVGLEEILETGFDGAHGVEARFDQHENAADAMRAAWDALGLELLPNDPANAADTLSAILYPDGVDSALLGSIKERGVIVAGGLYPGRKQDYFRVGHMGYIIELGDQLRTTVSAVEDALAEQGWDVEKGAAVAAFDEIYKST
ncbi:MAG: pyridoxal-phosphate-dependent aminotransferase family protein [Myxococcota bacterium]